NRYLHQDEFGPTRAERMSALRAMQTCVELLDSLIVNLPQHLALELTTTEPDQSLSFRILRSWTILRGWTMEQIHQAASTELAWRHSLHSADDLHMLEEICTRADAAIEVVSFLDTGSEGELFDDAVRTGLLVKNNVFSVIDAPLSALKAQVDLTLDRLRKQGGPERQVSLSWLVEEACDLWTRETGQPVTIVLLEMASTLAPQSRPPEGSCWQSSKLCSRLNLGLHSTSVGTRPYVRGSLLAPPADRARTIYSAMQKYVADHPRPGVRRGRPRAAQ